MHRFRHRLSALLCAVLIAGIISPAFSQAQLQIRLISVTSPARPGIDATIRVMTVPKAACTIAVYYKSGASRAQGLVPKTADTRGTVTWTWRVGTRTTPGTWPIVVKCSAGGKPGVLRTSFMVQEGSH